MSNELFHYGIKRRSGRYKWGTGKRPFQSDQGLRNLKNAKSVNLEKWGKSPSTNVLYISGLSGSGKSTIASSLAGPNDKVIHLDGYTESQNKKMQDPSFNLYLQKHLPDYGILSTHYNSSEYYKKVDDFRKNIEEFSKEEYKKNNRVIVEGIQINNGWFAENSYYDGKPVVVLNPNSKTAIKRAMKRDEVTNPELIERNLKNSEIAQERLDSFSSSINAQIGNRYIEEILKAR